MDVNATLVPVIEPLGYMINSLKVMLGGVFGIYLIVLYIRVREYHLVRRMYRELRRDLITLGEKQGIELPPLKESKLLLLHEHIIDWFKGLFRKKEVKEAKTARSKKVKR